MNTPEGVDVAALEPTATVGTLQRILRRMDPTLRHPIAGHAAGLAIAAGLPPWGWWPLPLLGLAWWAHLLADRPRRTRFLIGMLVGLGWFVPALLWMYRFSLPGYIAVLVLFTVGLGLVSVLAGGGRMRLLTLPAWLVLAEWLRWHAPFGGAPVAVLPMSQVGGPLLGLARVGGPLLITLAAAGLGAGLAGGRRTAAIVAVGVATLVGASALAPNGGTGPELRIAAVQGGGPQETRFSASQARPVFERHLKATEAVPEGLDLIVWPENVANVDGSFADTSWRQDVGQMAQRKGAPILVGSVEDVADNPDAFANFSQIVSAGGELGDRYDKQRRVPFGEYVPLRSLFTSIAGGNLPPRDQVPGPGPNIITSGDVRYGMMISWEVFFGRRARDAVDEGAEVLLNPTNGSSYWLSIVQGQQVASSRLRAVETGRDLVQAAPTGYSAIIDPNGNVRQRSSIGEERVLVATVHRRTGTTPAVALGDWPALAAAFGLILFGLAAERRRRSTRPRPQR